MIMIRVIFVGLLLCTSLRAETQTNRPASWAEPISLEGVPNLHKVSDDLYRSAQPTAAGMRALEEMGVRTILNLRSFHSDRDELAGTNLGYEHLYVKAWHPERKEVIRFLQLAGDPERTPLLVHCQHGADRTGALCAIYRIVVQNWTTEEALREMQEGGYGFHEVWQNLLDWIEELDIESLRKELAEPPTTALQPSTENRPPARLRVAMRADHGRAAGVQNHAHAAGV